MNVNTTSEAGSAEMALSPQGQAVTSSCGSSFRWESSSKSNPLKTNFKSPSERMRWHSGKRVPKYSA